MPGHADTNFDCGDLALPVITILIWTAQFVPVIETLVTEDWQSVHVETIGIDLYLCMYVSSR